MKRLFLILLCALLAGCETTGVSVHGPGYVLSYDKETGVAVHIQPSAK